jgi:hypothetical protein
MIARSFRLAMVGSGPGSFSGPVHRMAAELDGAFTLAAGAFSRDPAKSRNAAKRHHGLPTDRARDDYRAILDAETSRSSDTEIVAIVPHDHRRPLMCSDCSRRALQMQEGHSGPPGIAVSQSSNRNSAPSPRGRTAPGEWDLEIFHHDPSKGAVCVADF